MARKNKADPSRAQAASRQVIWDLCLYVAGQSSKSCLALSNLEEICENHLPGRYHIEVVDLLAHPQRAHEDQILAVPTLVRRYPLPLRETIGDLSQAERVLAGLDVPAAREGGSHEKK